MTTELSALEDRLAAALDRIAGGLARMSVAAEAGDDDAAVATAAGPGPDSDDIRAAAERIAELEAALDDERTANQQLTERVRVIRDKQESVVAALERNVARLTEQLDAQGRELQRQKRLNEELTETNRALSSAAERGTAEPHLINHALMSELEALRAQRASEIAEMDEILSELKPLIGEVA